MNKNIIIASFFVSLILLAPLSTTAPIISHNKIKKDTFEEYVIPLEEEQLFNLTQAVQNITNSELKNELSVILDQYLTENNEIYAKGLHELLSILEDYEITVEDEIYDFIDLIQAILRIIIINLIELPFIILIVLLEDVISIAQYTMEMVFEVINIINSNSISDIFSSIFSLLSDFNYLRYHIRQLPRSMEELENYIDEKIQAVINYVLEKMVNEIIPIVWEFSEPRLGYISTFANEIYETLLVSEEFIYESKVKLEHFKNIFVDLPMSYIDFKNAEEEDRFSYLIIFGTDLSNALFSALALYQDFTDNETELIDDIKEVISNLEYMSTYYNSEPWYYPIKITGTIKNNEGKNVTIYFSDPNQDDHEVISNENESFQLFYNTTKAENPYGPHTFTVIAERDEEMIEYNRTAFSDGIVEMLIDFEEESNHMQPYYIFSQGSFLLQIKQFIQICLDRIKSNI